MTYHVISFFDPGYQRKSSLSLPCAAMAVSTDYRDRCSILSTRQALISFQYRYTPAASVSVILSSLRVRLSVYHAGNGGFWFLIEVPRRRNKFRREKGYPSPCVSPALSQLLQSKRLRGCGQVTCR